MASLSIIKKAFLPGDPIFDITEGRVVVHTFKRVSRKYKSVVTDKGLLDPTEAGRTWFCFRATAERVLKERRRNENY